MEGEPNAWGGKDAMLPGGSGRMGTAANDGLAVPRTSPVVLFTPISEVSQDQGSI